VAAGRVACGVITHILHVLSERISHPLNGRINQFYSVHIYHAMARLDVPTFDNDATQRQLQNVASPPGSYSGHSVAWMTMKNILRILNTILQLVSQVGVLAHVLVNQRDGKLLAGLTLVTSLLQWRQLGSRTGWHSPACKWISCLKVPKYG
jgi:hypothetical protein